MLIKFYIVRPLVVAGWSSLAARRAHNPKVVGSNPAPATNFQVDRVLFLGKAVFKSSDKLNYTVAKFA